MVIVLNKILLFIFTFLIIGDSLKKNTILKNNNSFKSYEKYNVIIYRDTWGVPHIFGDKDEDTAYGLGYAHAEDDFATIQDILIAARGNLSEYY